MLCLRKSLKKPLQGTSSPPRGLASPEFFFLLQRIDRLDEKLSGEIRALDEKLSGEMKTQEARLNERIDRLDDKLSNLKLWMVGMLVTVIVGFGGVIVALLQR